MKSLEHAIPVCVHNFKDELFSCSLCDPVSGFANTMSITVLEKVETIMQWNQGRTCFIGVERGMEKGCVICWMVLFSTNTTHSSCMNGSQSCEHCSLAQQVV